MDYNKGAAYIMNSDKESVDDQAGVNKLYREGLEFPNSCKDRPNHRRHAKEANKAYSRSLFVQDG